MKFVTLDLDRGKMLRNLAGMHSYRELNGKLDLTKVG